MKKYILVLAGLMALVVGAIGAAAQSNGGDDLVFYKTAGPEVPIGGGVSFDIEVSNYGDEDYSDIVQLQDDLPVGIDWKIDDFTGFDGCSITNNILTCTDGFIGGPSIVGGQIVHNSSKVIVTGIATECGAFENTALFIWRGSDESLHSTVRQATQLVTCPATPTPTSPPATSTPVIVVITATPSPTQAVNTVVAPSITPKPPNTGTGLEQPQGAGFSVIYWMILGTVGGVGLLGLLTVFLWSAERMRRGHD